MAINQKHGVPRFSGAKFKGMHVGPFLDGTQRTYWASGQAPDGYAGRFNTYRKPRAWARPNSPLRVPQMVWLNLGIYGAPFATQTFQWYKTGWQTWVGDNDGSGEVKAYAGLPPTVHVDKWIQWNDGHIEVHHDNVPSDPTFVWTPGDATYVTPTLIFGTSTPAGPSPVLSSITAPNAWYQEGLRLQALFAAVKAAIESLRPNRTWVDLVTDWYDDPYNTAWWEYMIAPDQPQDQPWFGTNWLNIFCGGPASYNVNLFSGTNSMPGDNLPSHAPLPISSDPEYTFSRANFVAAYPSFAGCYTWLYNPPASYPGFSGSAPVDPTKPSNPFPGNIASNAFELFLEAQNASWASQFSTYNSDSTLITSYVTSYWTAVANDMAAYGFSYKGSTAQLADVRTVVGLIAQHFGFDPTTGLDLP